MVNYEEKSDVFISYERGSSFFAQFLVNLLKFLGLNCWIDIRNLRPGDELFEEIERGIHSSLKMISLWTPEYFEKEWPKIESKIKISFLSTGSKHKIIPIKLSNCEVPNSLRELENIIHIDASVEKELKYFVERIICAFRTNSLLKTIPNLDQFTYNNITKDERFTEEVIEIFELLEYKVHKNSFLQKKTRTNSINTCFIIEKKMLNLTIYRSLVICYDRSISFTEFRLIWDLYYVINSYKNEADNCKRIIVSSKGFSEDIKNELTDLGFVCINYNDLFLDLFSFDSYRSKQNYNLQELKNYNLQELKKDIGEEKELFVELTIESENSKDEFRATEYIYNWLEKEDSNILLILGRLGTGKLHYLDI